VATGWYTAAAWEAIRSALSRAFRAQNLAPSAFDDEDGESDESHESD